MVLDLSRVSVKCTALVNSGLPSVRDIPLFPAPKKCTQPKYVPAASSGVKPAEFASDQFSVEPFLFFAPPRDSIRTSIRRLMILVSACARGDGREGGLGSKIELKM